MPKRHKRTPVLYSRSSEDELRKQPRASNLAKRKRKPVPVPVFDGSDSSCSEPKILPVDSSSKSESHSDSSCNSEPTLNRNELGRDDDNEPEFPIATTST